MPGPFSPPFNAQFGPTSTSSGTVAFNPAVTFMITRAFRNMGVINDEEEPSGGMMNDGMFCANLLVKEWAASGIHVWTEEEAILFHQPGQDLYTLGPGSTDHATDANSWILNQVYAPGSQGASTITLSNNIGIIPGLNIGIVLDAGPTFWTTVNGGPAGNVIPLFDALPGSVSAGANVYIYQTPIARPLMIPSARRLLMITQSPLSDNPLTALNFNENPMQRFSRKEYMDLPNKRNPGTPTAFFYSPKLNNGLYYIWPVAQNSSTASRFTWYRPLQDFMAVANTGDFPQEWLGTFVWNLALELGPSYSVPVQRLAFIAQMASSKLEQAQGWDRESEPVRFGMGYDETQP